MHIVEALVNFCERPMVRDVLVNLYCALEVVWIHMTSSEDSVKRTEMNGKHSPSTRPGSSVRPLTPPKALPRQVRPVTSWNLHSHEDRITGA